MKYGSVVLKEFFRYSRCARLEHPLVDITSVDLNIPPLEITLFIDQHGYRIGLLSGRAPC